MFLINVPVGIIALFLVQLFVDEPEQVKKDRHEKNKHGIRIDYIGVILVALGLGFLEFTADRGEREDWFSSPLIVASAIIAVVSLIALVFWEVNNDDPVVDLKMLKNRNFAMVLLVMTVTGMVLFSTTQLIPQMLQQVMGYSALDAGLAMTAGGVATLIAVPFAGQLTGKVDVRILLIGAFVVQVIALWHLTHLNAEISFGQAAVARLISAAGLPFLFVPINAVAYIGLRQNQTAQASSLLNVFRNLGGTLGISTSQTLLAGQLQIHQSRLVEYAQPLNPNYTDWLASAQGALASTGDAAGSAMGVLYQTVQRQASMQAFLSVYWILMWIVIIATPSVLLMKSGLGGQAQKGMGH